MFPNFTTLTDTRNGRILLFGFLYFAQGAIAAYVLIFNNLYLRAFGAAAWQLSLLNGLLIVPFILKIGIGVLSDKVKLRLPLFGTGHRRPYISLGLLLISVSGIAAAFVPPVEMYPLFVLIALLIALGLALYDTVTDGYAIDVTPAEEQGQIQGVMVVGRALGVVILASVYGRIIEMFGWTVIFIAVALLTLTPQILLRFTHEPEHRASSQAFSWDALRSLWRPDIFRFSLYAIVYSVAIYGANAIVALFANEGLGQSLVAVGDVAALGGIGMVVGGALATYQLRRPTVSIWQQGVWTAAAVFVVLLLMALVADENNIMVMFVLWGICLSASELIYITLAMAKADRRMGAGQFAIFMAISNIGVGLGQSASTSLIDTIDFRWIFVGLAVINLLLFPLLAKMRQDDERDPNPLLTAVSGS
ncbi:MAG: MFS transporter [Ardenticatenaceae bacterium]|nr:MFS transporter [Anaerolineales bacterium]MCB9007903.1 MFS transporter [Ardenticatenaceae bacterium]